MAWQAGREAGASECRAARGPGAERGTRLRSVDLARLLAAFGVVWLLERMPRRGAILFSVAAASLLLLPTPGWLRLEPAPPWPAWLAAAPAVLYYAAKIPGLAASPVLLAMAVFCSSAAAIWLGRAIPAPWVARAVRAVT